MKSLLSTLAALISIAGCSMCQGQSYLDLAGRIVAQGQADQTYWMNAYSASVHQEQNLYRAAMNDPSVRARYQQFLASGGRASLEEFAVYYVRSAGGDPATFRNYMGRTAQLNSQDRANLFSTFEYTNGMNRQMFDERSERFSRYQHETGELLAGYANYGDSTGVYQVPTNLNRGQYSTDAYGNTFTVDHNNQYYRWTQWGWQPLEYRGR